jgi:hypothetical protein
MLYKRDVVLLTELLVTCNLNTYEASTGVEYMLVFRISLPDYTDAIIRKKSGTDDDGVIEIE